MTNAIRRDAGGWGHPCRMRLTAMPIIPRVALLKPNFASPHVRPTQISRPSRFATISQEPNWESCGFQDSLSQQCHSSLSLMSWKSHWRLRKVRSSTPCRAEDSCSPAACAARKALSRRLGKPIANSIRGSRWLGGCSAALRRRLDGQGSPACGHGCTGYEPNHELPDFHHSRLAGAACLENLGRRPGAA